MEEQKMQVKSERRVRFDSLKEYITFFGLEGYIKERRKTVLGYGIQVENHVYEQLKFVGLNVKKCSPEYDMIKGADLRVVFQGSSILVDIKLNESKATKNNLYYIKDGMEFSRDKDDMFMFPLGKELEVGFALRNIRRGEDGYCVLDKPVLVALIRNNSKEERDMTKLLNYKAAYWLATMIELVNNKIMGDGYPSRDTQAFDFVFYNKGSMELP
jgi:hypothetical protein